MGDKAKVPAKFYNPCPEPHSDHVYKIDHGVDVGLRLWPAETEEPAPWLFWVHGGGWAGGYHHRMLGWVIPAFRAKGYHIVSVGYRLVPHVGRETQIKDLQDAYSWCRSNLPNLVKVDLPRYVVAGDSAGGYWTLFSPFILNPPPMALIDLYGPTDITRFKFSPEMEAERAKRQAQKVDYLLPGKTEKDYEEYWSDRDPSRALTFAPWWWDLENSEETMQSFLAMPEYKHTDRYRLVMDLYRSPTAQAGRLSTWLRKEIFKTDEDYNAYAKKSSPIYKLDEVQSYPPTFILHGTGDAAVPVEQSYDLEKKLKAKGIPVDSRYEEGGEHSFEARITSPDEPGWKKYIEPAMAFVDEHVRK